MGTFKNMGEKIPGGSFWLGIIQVEFTRREFDW